MNRETVYKHALKYFDGDTLAADVWVNKYCLRDGDDYKEKTPDDMHRRLAREFARIEKDKFAEPLSEDEIFELFKNFERIVPQGSPMYGIGNDYTYQSLGNCFTLGEHPYDSYAGILYADQMLVQLAKRRSGVGLNLDKIRPKGLPTKNAAITTDGIGVFMERFSNSTREVAQSGRRGALLQCISVHHPEIETFINIKRDKTKVTGANISVLLTEEFMKALKGGGKYEQRWPVEGEESEIRNMVSAKKIWDQIIDSVHNSAEPGMLFIDNIRKWGTSHCYGVIDKRMNDRVTNPCYHPEERLLTKNGYIKFIQLLEEEIYPEVITDNRISFKEKKWHIDLSKNFTSVRNASKVRLTQKDAEILEVETNFGYSVKVTPEHHIATKRGMIEAKNLSLEKDKILIPVVENNNYITELPKTVEEIDAFLIGMITGDGCFYKNTYRTALDFWGEDKERMANICKNYIQYLFDNQMVEEDKFYNRPLLPYTEPEIKEKDKIRIDSSPLGRYLKRKYGFCIHNKHEVLEKFLNEATQRHILYYLSALFYCDGHVEGSKKSGFTVRLSQSNRPFLKDVQLLLHAHGLLFSLNKARDEQYKELPGGTYLTKAQYRLISVGCHHQKFQEKLKFFHPEKDDKLNKILKQYPKNPKKNYWSKICEIKKCDNSDVYCLEEPVTQSVVVNGVTARRCGEVPMSFDSCRLMLINLYSYVKHPFTPNAYFDYKYFGKDCRLGQRLMDDMVDLEIEKINKIIEKVKSDPEPEHVKQIELEMWQSYKEVAELGRRTGLGITGLGDCLAALGIRYGSRESVDTTEEIYKTLAIESMISSCLMAKELGPFPLYNEEVEKGHPLLRRFFAASSELAELHLNYGRRNISLTTTAPAGSVSILTKTTSGIEPAFLLEYNRRRKLSSDEKEKCTFKDDLGDMWEEYTVYHHHFNTWREVTGKNNVEESPYFGGTANDVDWEVSVDLQAAAQRWITHSISKTCNVPADTPKELIDKIYMRAYDEGCKGFTVYRDGCRSGVLTKKEDKFSPAQVKNRPQTVECDVYHPVVGGESYFVMVGVIDNKPYEVFAGRNGMIRPKIKKGRVEKIKKPKCYRAILEDETVIQPITMTATDSEEALNRMISLLLQSNRGVQDVVDQIEKISGNMNSYGKAIARALKKYIPDGTSVDNDCPECGERTLIRQEGCTLCQNCGYSGCS